MTKALAKTIEIFLPDGDPKGVKVASITSRTVQVTYIPRNQLEAARARENLGGVGVYFLVGTEEFSKPEVYIGEAENCMVRLAQHNAGKDFWQYALVVTSRTGQFTKTHGKYLEWLCYDTGKRLNRCQVQNSTIPTKPHVGESMEADLHDSFETIAVLVSTLGLPIFQPARGGTVSSAGTEDGHGQVFSLRGRGGDAKGIYTEEGFTVFAGSRFAKTLAGSAEKASPLFKKMREQLIQDGILTDEGEYYELKEDFIFPSPSNASGAVTGQSMNGWEYWKREDGKTLDEVFRKN